MLPKLGPTDLTIGEIPRQLGQNSQISREIAFSLSLPPPHRVSMKIMKTAFLTALCASWLACGVALCAGAPAEEYRSPPFLMPDLKPPEFPERTFNIVDYGAVPDGKTKNTVAFAKAIAACNQAGGGRVVVTAGTWYTGPIIFKSNVDLHLEKGAVVSFSSDPVDYAPSVFASLGRARPGLICNNEGQNIALTGDGEFQGNGQPWWKPVTEKKKLKLKRDPRVSTIPAEFSFIDPGTGKQGDHRPPHFRLVQQQHQSSYRRGDLSRWPHLHGASERL